MPDFALLKNGVVEDIRSYPSQPDNLPHKGVTWLPYLVVKPDYTPATQIRTGPVRTIDTAVTDTWTVRDKTAQELAAEADAAKVQVADNNEIMIFSAGLYPGERSKMCMN